MANCERERERARARVNDFVINRIKIISQVETMVMVTQKKKPATATERTYQSTGAGSAHSTTQQRQIRFVIIFYAVSSMAYGFISIFGNRCMVFVRFTARCDDRPHRTVTHFRMGWMCICCCWWSVVWPSRMAHRMRKRKYFYLILNGFHTSHVHFAHCRSPPLPLPPAIDDGDDKRHKHATSCIPIMLHTDPVYISLSLSSSHYLPPPFFGTIPLVLPVQDITAIDTLFSVWWEMVNTSNPIYYYHHRNNIDTVWAVRAQQTTLTYVSLMWFGAYFFVSSVICPNVQCFPGCDFARLVKQQQPLSGI